MTKKVILFFILLVFLFTFPGILHITNRMFGDPGDGYQFMGFQYLGYKEFFSGHFPIAWTNYWRYPYGVNFQEISDASLFTIFGIILYPIFHNPIFVYNISLFLLLFLNLYLSYIFFKLFFNRTPSLIGTVIYGASFYTLARMQGHVNLVLHASILFLFFSLVKIYTEKGKKINFLYFTLSIISVAFSSLQYVLLCLGTAILLMTLVFLFYKDDCFDAIVTFWKSKYLLISSFLLSFITIFLFHGDKILALINKNMVFPSSKFGTTPIINWVIPNAYISKIIVLFSVNNTYRWIENVTFFGYVEIILIILSLIFVKNSKEKIFLMSAFTLFLIISLGRQEFLSFIWPYQYIYHFFPFNGIPESGRFVIISSIFSTLLILLYLKEIKNKYILMAIFLLIIFERLPLNIPISDNQYNQNFITAVRRQDSSAVIDFPIYTHSGYGQMYDILSIYYNKPIVNGYFNWSADYGKTRLKTDEFSRYSCFKNDENTLNSFDLSKAEELKSKILYFMKKNNINVIVVHKDLFFNNINCNNTRLYIKNLLGDKAIWKTIFNTQRKEVWVLKY